MRASQRLKALGVLLLAAALGACATTRSEIKIASPVAQGSATTASQTGRVVVIAAVFDERVFEDKPRDPSAPSLGFGGAAQASSDVKARAIGRKRGGLGLALGDVLLDEGQTVEGLVRENLGAALKQAGFQVLTAADAGTSPLILDVHIRKLWAWFEPGFWAIKLHCDVSVDLAVRGRATPVTISADVADSRQVATESAWMQVVVEGMDKLRSEVIANAGRLK